MTINANAKLIESLKEDESIIIDGFKIERSRQYFHVKGIEYKHGTPTLECVGLKASWMQCWYYGGEDVMKQIHKELSKI